MRKGAHGDLWQAAKLYPDTGRNVLSLYLLVYLCVSVLQLFCSSTLYAQRKSNSSAAVSAPDDHAPVRVRYPKTERLRALQMDRDYQYDRDPPPPDNPFARFIDYLFRRIMRFLASDAYQSFWQYVLLAVISAFVVYMLLKAELLGYLFPKQAQSVALDYKNFAENIHETNFDTVIETAVGQRNYRLATRLLYLQTLKQLTDTGQIQYKPDKTNRQCLNELSGSPRQAEFERLTRQFEFVWYGEFPVDETRFTDIRTQFRAFQAQSTPKVVN